MPIASHAEEIYPLRGGDVTVEKLWSNALDVYRQTTQDDWRKPDSKFHDLYCRLEKCAEENSVLDVLDAEVQKFEAYRHGPEIAAKLRAIMLPIARCVLAVIEVGGETGAAKVRLI